MRHRARLQIINIDKNLWETIKLVSLHFIVKDVYSTASTEIEQSKFSDVLKQQAENYVVSVWVTAPDLFHLRCFATPKFVKTLKKGLKCHLGGKWEDARSILGKVDQMMSSNHIGGVGLSLAILKYMEANAWSCPVTWSGYRPLTRNKYMLSTKTTEKRTGSEVKYLIVPASRQMINIDKKLLKSNGLIT
ncbi:hypothetical protein ACHAW6_006618 [Cyclotella cf. meneghiniana]